LATLPLKRFVLFPLGAAIHLPRCGLATVYRSFTGMNWGIIYEQFQKNRSSRIEIDWQEEAFAGTGIIALVPGKKRELSP
jgi:hypothetical protein